MARQLVIDGRTIDDDSPCYVIAEIGNNHQGDVEKAKELIAAAKEAGADAAKLQKRHNPTLFTQEMYASPYENENSFGPTYGEHREALEFGLDEYQELQAYSAKIGITFFATAFDIASADFLHSLDVPAFKIASGDLKSTPLLRHVASFGKPMVVSTGGAIMEDVVRAYEAIKPINPQFCFLQCTAGYPPAFDELNLRVIETYRERFPDIVVGLSSHDSGIAMSLVAYMLGARVIEKHFTLNRALKGTDHAFSLERPGLRRVVRDLARAHEALGDGSKRQYESEKKPMFKMAKKLVAAHGLEAGHVLAPEDVVMKSPGDGLSPQALDGLLGKKLKRALKAEENLALEDFG